MMFISLSFMRRVLPLFIFFSFVTAPSHAEKLTYWQQRDDTSVASVNHSEWQKLLSKYIITNNINTDKNANKPNLNLFAYQSVSAQDKTQLENYLSMLQQLDPRSYNGREQQAYWINLYNALTVNLILNNYPTSSITKLGDKFFAFGPWDDIAATINAKQLTLNDIEHKILRPIWRDPRVHYAVNCASYSCPNLSRFAFTADNLEQQLEQGAINYINDPRGVTIVGEDLILSKIYKWYAEDFGNDETKLIKHLQNYAMPSLRQQLDQFLKQPGDIDYEYDWRLNQS